ncbi:DUF3298 domain-containing protein [Mycobacteroides chelonae]|nr:DUF3298 domain-containing protein [Mycobacteroides chelonae]
MLREFCIRLITKHFSQARYDTASRDSLQGIPYGIDENHWRASKFTKIRLMTVLMWASQRTMTTTAMPLAAVIVLAVLTATDALADTRSYGIDYVVMPDAVVGTSWDGLGDWHVTYQYVSGGNPDIVAAINDGIDAEVSVQVSTQRWRPSATHHWTFNSTGTLSFGPVTISELFIGEYHTDLPNMPSGTVATCVFDSRSGMPVTWASLFRDKDVGIARLSEQTSAIMARVYPPPYTGAWQLGGGAAPIDLNFRYWIPTAQGIELHFPDYQFGRGSKEITVPWTSLADLIAPEFLPIMG